jgi:hypothetical protein
MRFTIVRHSRPGCEPHCAEWIAAEGDVVEGSAAQFRKIIKSMGDRRLPVFVHSRGGAIEDAIRMGKIIREKGLDVAVARTELDPCRKGVKSCKSGRAPKGSTGRPVSSQAYCASACALILGGGVRRLVSPWSGIGVHQIQTLQTLVRLHRTYRIETRTDNRGRVKKTKKLISEKRVGSSTKVRKTKESTYDSVEDFLVASGIDASIVPIMRATPHSDLHWLTLEEQRSTRMTTDFVGAAFLVAETEAKAAGAAEPDLPPPAALGPAVKAVTSLRLGPYFTAEVEAEVSLDHTLHDDAVGLEIKLGAGGEPLATTRMLADVRFPDGRNVEASLEKAAITSATFRASVPAAWLCEASASSTPLRIVFDLEGSREPASALPTQLHLRQLDHGAELVASACPASKPPPASTD